MKTLYSVHTVSFLAFQKRGLCLRPNEWTTQGGFCGNRPIVWSICWQTLFASGVNLGSRRNSPPYLSYGGHFVIARFCPSAFFVRDNYPAPLQRDTFFFFSIFLSPFSIFSLSFLSSFPCTPLRKRLKISFFFFRKVSQFYQSLCTIGDVDDCRL